MEEVVGSIPTRSTKSLKNLDRAVLAIATLCDGLRVTGLRRDCRLDVKADGV